MILDFQPSELLRKKFPFFLNHLVYGSLLQPPKQTKALGIMEMAKQPPGCPDGLQVICERERIKRDFRTCGLIHWKKRVGFPEMGKGRGGTGRGLVEVARPGVGILRLTSHETHDSRYSCYASKFWQNRQVSKKKI